MAITKINFVLTPALVAEHKSLKVDAIRPKLNLIRRAVKLFRKVDLTQLNHTTCAEDLEFRKSVFPNYRFWMRDVKCAGREGLLSRQEVIDLSTFARAIAVQVIGELRSQYPAQPTFIEVVECDETGRPVIEVQAEQIAELQAENKQLTNENASLSRKLSKVVNALENVKEANQALVTQNQLLINTLGKTSEVIQSLNY